MSAPADHVRFNADNASSDDSPMLSSPLPVRDFSVPARLSALRSARTLLLEAAQPLLRALADVRSKLLEESMHVFHALLDPEFGFKGRFGLRDRDAGAACWALLGLVEKGCIVNTAVQGGLSVEYVFDGCNALLEIVAGSRAHPLGSDSLLGFRCPSRSA